MRGYILLLPELFEGFIFERSERLVKMLTQLWDLKNYFK